MGFYSGYRCDKCSKEVEYSSLLTKSSATTLAREKGYSVGKRVLCFGCRDQFPGRKGLQKMYKNMGVKE